MNEMSALKNSQQLMIDDGFPAELFITQEEREAVWKAHPPRPLPAFYNVDDEKQRELRAKFLKEATDLRILKLKANLARKAQKINPKDIRGKRWDPRTAKWIPIDRGINMIKDDPKIAKLEDETTAGNEVVSVSAEENEMSKTPKTKKSKKSSTPKTPKTAKPKAEKKAAVPKKAKKATNGTTKVIKEPKKGGFLSVIADMLNRKSGATAEEVAEKLGWKTISIPRNARTLGMKIRKEKVAGKPARFYAD